MNLPEIDAEKFELANGIKLFVVEQPGLEVVSVQAWCETGSIHESDMAGAGMTHALEHMLFKGTPTRSAADIGREIHEAGGYLNAYTSFDRTVFWVDCPSTALNKAIDLLGDMLLRSSIEESELNRELDVIRREFEMGYDDPERMLSQLTFGTAFQTHPCRFPVIGLRPIFDQITHARLLRYYRDRYVPNNLFIVVCGDVVAEKVEHMVEHSFGVVPPAPLAPILVPEEPRQQGVRYDSRIFASQLGYFSLAWHVPDVGHPDVPALDLLSLILGGGASSHLYHQLREEKGTVYALSAFSFTPNFPGLFSVSGTSSLAELSNVEDAVLAEITRWRKDGITDASLQKVKRIVLVSSLEQLQTAKGVASDLGLNWIYTRNLHFNRRYLTQIQSVSAEEIVDVADRYLTTENLSVVKLGPEKETRRRSRNPTLSDEPFVRVLPNGIRIVFQPDSRLPLIHASFTLGGGVIAENAKNNGISRLHASALLKGTERLSSAEIAEKVEALGGTLFGESGYNSTRVGFSSLVEDFSEILELVAEIMSAPLFPENGFERERASQIASIEADDAQPSTVARNRLRSEIYGSHPYGLPSMGTKASVANILREDVVRLHQRILQSSPAVLAVCGQFDADLLWEQLNAWFGNFPNRQQSLGEALPELRPMKSREVTIRQDKNQGFVTIGFLACPLGHPDRIAFELLDEATGDSSSRFFLKIREELGLAYSVGSSLSLGLAPGFFSVYAATAPEMTSEVAMLCESELAQLARTSLGEAEFQRSKTKLLAQLGFQKQNLESHAHGLALNELYGFGANYLAQRKEELDRTTLADVQKVCTKYLMDKPSVRVIVTNQSEVT